MSADTKPEFGKWRSLFWPIHAYELKKLLPMFFMFFFISFNYTILRDTKDTLIVTSSGAEAIPFLKFWGVVPSAILFMIIFAKLSNVLSKQSLFYVTLTPFVIFFALFPTVLYPNREALHPTASAEMLHSILGDGFNGLIAIYRNWTFSVFYILAELWGSVVLSLLFWGFANEITKISEAKRFYSLFGIGANIALLVSGPAIIYVSAIREKVPAGMDPWQMSLNYLMGMAIVAGIAVMAIYRYINTNVLTDPRFFDPTQVKKKKEKPKMSIGESFGYLMKSKYILCLAVLVIGYGISINIVEVTWKNQLKQQYPNPNDYSTFMGYFSTVTGAVTILMMLFVGGNVIRRLGWGAGAMATPLMLLVTGTLFFAFVLFRDQLSGLVAAFGTTPLYMAVMIGAAQNILSKSSKYAMFDPTKEMAYIPLDQEQKVKGKAAIDVVGARLGKSGGAVIQQGLLVALGGSIAAITPYVAVILFFIVGGWMVAARSLNQQFLALTVKTAVAEPVSTKTPEPKLEAAVKPTA